MVHAHCRLDTESYKCTLIICNAYCFPLQQWLHEHSSLVCYMYVAYLVYYSLCPIHFCHCSDQQKVDCFSVRHVLAPVWLYSLVMVYLRGRFKYIFGTYSCA
jgi:hypothetical protein